MLLYKLATRLIDGGIKGLHLRFVPVLLTLLVAQTEDSVLPQNVIIELAGWHL